MTAITRDAVRPSPLPLVMLVARLALFALFQALFAVALGSWDASTGYWPLTAALTNIVLIPVLIWLFARDGEAYLQLFRISRAGLAADLSWLAAVLVIALPLAYFPSL